MMIRMEYNNHQRSFGIELDDGNLVQNIAQYSLFSVTQKQTFYSTHESPLKVEANEVKKYQFIMILIAKCYLQKN